jgi:hypothetical protein
MQLLNQAINHQYHTMAVLISVCQFPTINQFQSKVVSFCSAVYTQNHCHHHFTTISPQSLSTVNLHHHHHGIPANQLITPQSTTASSPSQTIHCRSSHLHGSLQFPAALLRASPEHPIALYTHSPINHPKSTINIRTAVHRQPLLCQEEGDEKKE